MAKRKLSDHDLLALVDRLDEPLPLCPFDDGPNACRTSDTRVLAAAKAAIEQLMAERATPITIDAEDFDELEAAMSKPVAPTQSIRDAAKLMRELYPTTPQVNWEARALAAEASLQEAREALERAETVLGNMAQENEGAVFNRWPINHEPLRADAKVILPIIAAAIRTAKGTE